MANARPPALNRKLSAVLYADVHGYSRLMDRDEPGTVAKLTRSLTLIRMLVGDYGGTVVNTAGDGLVALFESASQALHFAMEMQRQLPQESAWDDDPIAYRIGITVGDTIPGEDGVYGHSVNLAARIQALATPGGICIADTVYQIVRSDPGIKARTLGKHNLKNIEEAVEIFAVDVAPPSAPFQQIEIPRAVQQPAVSDCSLAVLPLENVSGDPADIHLCQGVVADLISNLCRFRNLMVIARRSAFLVADGSRSLREIGNLLGVRYLLTGGFRRVGHQLRVSVDLIEAQSESIIWSERYDGTMADIFAFQDDVTATTASRLAVHIEHAEKRRLQTQHHPNVHAYGLILRGQELDSRFRPDSNAHARRLFEQARTIASQLGFEIGHAATGGGSDGNTVASMGVPTVDGLGPIGGDDHSPGEYLELASIAPRVALMAALLTAIGRGAHDGPRM